MQSTVNKHTHVYTVLCKLKHFSSSTAVSIKMGKKRESFIALSVYKKGTNMLHKASISLRHLHIPWGTNNHDELLLKKKLTLNKLLGNEH